MMDEFKRAYIGAKGTFWVVAIGLAALAARGIYNVL